MLRISPVRCEHKKVTLKLEGSVAGPWVAEVKKACETILISGHDLKLDLGEVAFVDREGVALFADLQVGGATFEGCSPFVAAQLGALKDG